MLDTKHVSTKGGVSYVSVCVHLSKASKYKTTFKDYLGFQTLKHNKELEIGRAKRSHILICTILK